MAKKSIKARKLFGVYVPPYDPPKLAAGAVTLRFLITGHIPSKKNNQTVRRCFDKSVAHLKESLLSSDKPTNISSKQAFDIAMQAINKVYIGYIGNEEYKGFSEANVPKLLEQAAYWSKKFAHKGLIFPLSNASVIIRFFWEKDYNNDTINKAQSIQDLLVDAHIIQDDNYKIIDPVHLSSQLSKGWVNQNVCQIILTINLTHEQSANSSTDKKD
jgi:hypothetical protein